MGNELRYGDMPDGRGLLALPLERLAEIQELGETTDEFFRSTPTEWAGRLAAARAGRVAERASAERVPLTLDALLNKLEWSHAYAEHVVQPYCQCSEGRDGWVACRHAADENVKPYDA